MLVNGKQGILIGIRDRGLLYGDGVFRTLLACKGHALHWPLHFQKLQRDCAVLGIPCPGFAILSAELNNVLLNYPDGVVKLIVTRGSGIRGYALPDSIEPTRIWDVAPKTEYPLELAIHGIKSRFCQFRLSRQPRLAGVKHLNRLENVLAAAEFKDSDVTEGLLMDEEDHVIGGTRSNLFLVSQGKLITPELSHCGVAGVQRDRVMAWAEQSNMPIQVCEVGLDEVMNADEVFVTNSVMTLWPIRELGKRCWTDFPVAEGIRIFLEDRDTK